MLIAHQDEIEAQLAQVLPQVAPHAFRGNYLIMGTVERKDWRRGLTDPLSSKEMIEALHDFEDHLHFKPAPLWTRAGPRDGPAKPR